MTLSSILSGLMINAASLALARKLILVSIDIYFMFDRKLMSKLSQCVWKDRKRGQIFAFDILLIIHINLSN
jgi:hypothetical protein